MRGLLLILLGIMAMTTALFTASTMRDLQPAPPSRFHPPGECVLLAYGGDPWTVEMCNRGGRCFLVRESDGEVIREAQDSIALRHCGGEE